MTSSFLDKVLFVLVIGLAEVSKAQEALDAEPDPVFPEKVDWERVVRGFRHDHNFSFNLGFAQNHWKGYLQRTSESFQAKSDAFELEVDYSFHLPLFGSLGYTLGTGASWVIEEAVKDADAFKVDRSFSLPGISVGLVWNINERWRTLSTFTYGWQRIERLRLKTPFASENIAVSGDVRSFRWAFDYFYQLSWALRFQMEQSDFAYTSKESLDLEKSAREFQIGLAKHLL